jgi:hypothetical protein
MSAHTANDAKSTGHERAPTDETPTFLLWVGTTNRNTDLDQLADHYQDWLALGQPAPGTDGLTAYSRGEAE